MIFKTLTLMIFVWPLAWGADCNPGFHLLQEKFFPYAFGKEARTVDYSEFEQIASYLKEIKNNKKYEVSKSDILVCTSDYRLPPISVTQKNENEHLDLALQRASGLKKELKKLGIKAEVSHKLCGPAFRKLDMNWRFISKEYMNDKYQEAYRDIEKTDGIIEMYKTEALIKSFDEVKNKYQQPFLAKYKPFNGYRVRVFGSDVCPLTHHEIETSKEKGKGAQQE
jgi:hypothetical protein